MFYVYAPIPDIEQHEIFLNIFKHLFQSHSDV